MLWVLAVIVGLILVVPGVEILRWFVVDFIHLYDELSLTDGCLVILIVLQAAILIHFATWQRQTEGESQQLRRSARSAKTSRPAAGLTGNDHPEQRRARAQEQQQRPRSSSRGSSSGPQGQHRPQ